MKCPACFNELSEVQVGSVKVDVCQGGCGGIWFDAFELQQVDEQAEAAGDHLLEISRDHTIVVDPKRKRECPKCEGVKLMRHFFSAKRDVEVDQCPNCAGYWLDAGELARIRAEKSQTAEPSKTISGEVIRYLYRLKTEGKSSVQ
ncbi:MAG TPA: zf-TFIIB domain-containing protein [Candidatus Dormibacteraeota bacterium]|nr:zf-TFIIB domain-containing protein [Candidatus Dormibacteraeota bacterium]